MMSNCQLKKTKSALSESNTLTEMVRHSHGHAAVSSVRKTAEFHQEQEAKRHEDKVLSILLLKKLLVSQERSTKCLLHKFSCSATG